MKKLLSAACLLFALWPKAGLAQQTSTNKMASTKLSAAAALDSMLAETGYEFSKADTNVFVTKVAGNKMKDILIIATESEGMTILFCMVKEKAGALLTVAQSIQLMKLTMEYDRIKIGLDDEENLMVRIDLKSRLTDTKDLTENLDQLGVAVDEAFAIVSKK